MAQNNTQNNTVASSTNQYKAESDRASTPVSTQASIPDWYAQTDIASLFAVQEPSLFDFFAASADRLREKILYLFRRTIVFFQVVASIAQQLVIYCWHLARSSRHMATAFSLVFVGLILFCVSMFHLRQVSQDDRWHHVSVQAQEQKNSPGSQDQISEIELDTNNELSTSGVNNYFVSGLRVEIAGAVEKPGVYTMESGARVVDVLEAAGGLSNRADSVEVAHLIHLAAQVTDGQKIYIPFEGELLEDVLAREYVLQLVLGDLRRSVAGVNQVTSGSGTVIENEGKKAGANDTIADEDKKSSGNESEADSISSNERAEVTGKISINTASESELMTLKNIGAKRASDIVAGRPYQQVEDLVAKSILGNALFENIRSELVL